MVLEGYIIVPSTDLAMVQDALPDHIRLTRAEPGCIIFEVKQSSADLNRFHVYEEFTDRDAFDAHQVRTRNSYWAQVTESAERHYTLSVLE